MRKVRFFGLAFVALCALSAMLSTTAFALTYTLAEWLVSGVAVPAGGKPASTATGSLTFENTSSKGAILCAGIFNGHLLEDGEDEINEVLTTGGVAVKALDSEVTEKGISCVGVSLCSSGEIWPTTLPILTLLELMEPEGTFEDLLLSHEGKLPGYLVLCETIIGMVEELCEALEGSGGLIKSATGGAEAEGSVEPFGTCNGTAEVGKITADPGNHITSEGLEVEPSN